MKINKHSMNDLRQMQSLPLEAKIRMTKARIEQWYESWNKLEIYNKKTKKTKYVIYNVNGDCPELKQNESIAGEYPGAVYVSFSGGKDSTVLKHIIDSMYSDVPALFVDTGLEYPEIRQFVKSVKNGDYSCFNNDVEIVRPKIRFDEVIKTYGYPIISKEVAKKIHEGRSAIKNGNPNNYVSRQFDGTYVSKNGKTNTSSMKKWKFVYESDIPVSHMCCNIMKKNPAKTYEKEHQRVPFLGNMASESRLRYNEWLAHGCNAFDTKRPTSNPLSFWTEQDILEYLIKYNVPYCSVYGDIVKDDDGKLKTTKCERSGCMFCGFGCHLEKEPNRFQKLKETHPRQYDYCINGGEYVDGVWIPNKYGLGMRKPLEFIGVNVD